MKIVLGLGLGLLVPLGAHAQIVEYYHLDGIGNVRAVTESSLGTVIERHDYLPFGEECTAGPCATSPGVGAGQPKKFTGKERDAETGFDYFGARYYGSRVGRFTTTDPAMDLRANVTTPQKWNRYAYGLNNPLRFVDPDGRQERAQQLLDADVSALVNGQITRAEYIQRQAARGAGVVGGLAVLAAAYAPRIATELLIATGRCGASAACQNAVRAAAEAPSGAPGAMGTIPTLGATGNHAMFQEALGYVTGSTGSAAQKVQLFEALAEQITARSGGSWSATRGAATNAAGVWVGETRPFGLAIDNAGKVWTTQNIHEGATFGTNGALTIDFSKWTQR